MNAQLVMFRPNGERQDVALKRSRMLIGRDERCDIRIALPEVSRRHAEIRLADGRLTLTDLGSANGTYVNNVRADQHALRAGDYIIIGPLVFTVQIDGQPASIRPVKTKLRRRLALAAQPVAHAGRGAVALDDDDDPIAALEALAGDTAHADVAHEAVHDPPG